MQEYFQDDALEGATISREAQALFDVTLLPSDPKIPAKTAADLEWEGLVELVMRRTLTPEGEEIAGRLGPLPSAKHAQLRLQQVAECMALLETEDDLPLRGAS